jgi:hypothetical protein
MTGTAGTGGAGNVLVNQNGTGMTITQDATGTGPSVSLSGVVVWNNTNDGIDVLAGSPMTMRGCYVLKNGGKGVDVQPNTTATITMIDFGNAVNGGNTLQSTTDPNAASGICLETGGTLFAQGNIFSGTPATNCATGGPLSHNTTCTGAKDVSSTVGGVISTDNCTQP